MRANKRTGAAVGAAVAFLVLVFAIGHQMAGRDRDGGSAGSTGTSAAASSAQAGKTDARTPRKVGDKPWWRSLTPAQQRALQPLQGEWDSMDSVRKGRWLQLASRFGTMNPEQQQRMHERMRAWVKLSPEQRELARETYSRTRKIAPDQKTATWENYQLLPDEQKRQLAASAATRKPQPAPPSQTTVKAVTPLGGGAAACPAGTVRNAVSASPPCVPVAPAGTPPVAPPATPPAVPPAQPTPPAQPEKPVPANWGISPNNA